MIGFSKQAYEEFSIAADFSENMEDAETIATTTVAAIDKDTGDAAGVVGTATVDGQTSVAPVSGGAPGKTYVVTFQAVTSAGNRWELDIGMKVE